MLCSKEAVPTVLRSMHVRILVVRIGAVLCTVRWAHLVCLNKFAVEECQQHAHKPSCGLVGVSCEAHFQRIQPIQHLCSKRLCLPLNLLPCVGRRVILEVSKGPAKPHISALANMLLIAHSRRLVEAHDHIMVVNFLAILKVHQSTRIANDGTGIVRTPHCFWSLGAIECGFKLLLQVTHDSMLLLCEEVTMSFRIDFLQLFYHSSIPRI
mmetsp:Transcript_26287/g.48006  ORF Transcript_26287/g.48006 Transcript_26287/m.48006 type:complete len:210 (+) Transcript_26287:247-876(+)